MKKDKRNPYELTSIERLQQSKNRKKQMIAVSLGKKQYLITKIVGRTSVPNWSRRGFTMVSVDIFEHETVYLSNNEMLLRIIAGEQLKELP